MRPDPRLAAALALLAPPAAAQGTSLFQEGAPLPHLELPTIDGRGAIDLASLRDGKTLLIQFASW